MTELQANSGFFGYTKCQIREGKKYCFIKTLKFSIEFFILNASLCENCIDGFNFQVNL